MSTALPTDPGMTAGCGVLSKQQAGVQAVTADLSIRMGMQITSSLPAQEEMTHLRISDGFAGRVTLLDIHFAIGCRQSM